MKTLINQVAGIFVNVDTPGSTVEGQLTSILNVVYLVAGLVAIIVIAVAGIKYSSSRGDSGKVEEAKKTILYAVIGLGVAVFAFALTTLIAGKFQ
jgi:cytochrome bd-type quinol oxidase subunit 2